MVSKKSRSAIAGREIATLYSFGLNQDEIRYLIHLKSKMIRAKKKWG